MEIYREVFALCAEVHSPSCPPVTHPFSPSPPVHLPFLLTLADLLLQAAKRLRANVVRVPGLGTNLIPTLKLLNQLRCWP